MRICPVPSTIIKSPGNTFQGVELGRPQLSSLASRSCDRPGQPGTLQLGEEVAQHRSEVVRASPWLQGNRDSDADGHLGTAELAHPLAVAEVLC